TDGKHPEEGTRYATGIAGKEDMERGEAAQGIRGRYRHVDPVEGKIAPQGGEGHSPVQDHGRREGLVEDLVGSVGVKRIVRTEGAVDDIGPRRPSPAQEESQSPQASENCRWTRPLRWHGKIL